MVWSLLTRREQRREKLEIEQGGVGRRAQGALVFEQRLFPNRDGDRAGAAIDGAVLAGDFHLEDLPGVLPGGDPGVGQEGDETLLEGAETALDFGSPTRRPPYSLPPPRPLAWGVGATRWATPKARRARWNSLLGSP